ncbi:hypothetical protein TRAPUB_12133 [Trametes pubescens]|uniref:Aminoglycoside phosphotransferase domain-containing protein n=1 Tax=Trametes pubescens TaxID=154538 RepID=A0A1M2VUQ1_TRAPU|nr:hypothetical protein TRAPUB_12133 [Trametes pubescens]
MSWITYTISRALWALWRCFPSSVRLAVYNWVERRYGRAASNGYRARLLPFGLVFKRCSSSPHYEAENIRFIANNTSVPVPRILDVVEYTSPQRTQPSGLIIMTRLEGESLEKWIYDRTIYAPGQSELLRELEVCMEKGNLAALNAVIAQLDALPKPTLDLSEAGPLMQDLRDAFTELRSITPPVSPAVSGLSGGPVRCNRGGDSMLIGPFQDQQDFKDALFAQANSVLFPHRMPTLQRLAAPVNATRHRICFTHADLAARNILVKDGRLSGIVDWEFAGWYPEYWELVAMEMQMVDMAVLHQFWDAVQLFGREPYRDALALEWALGCCTGEMMVMGEAGDDMSCPRIAGKKRATATPSRST